MLNRSQHNLTNPKPQSKTHLQHSVISPHPVVLTSTCNEIKRKKGKHYFSLSFLGEML